ncbi:hypothetical protein MP228_008246 [Amoeboaphelidium protococcarum]|nr:hypothetical protein MP228_008246 [Amoeboaphelidium protococcarum]
MEKYEPLNVIGKGSFGVIRKCRRKSDGQCLVWKEIDYRKMSTNEKKQLVSEVNVLRELKHPNIVRYHERIVDKENCLIFIVMEFCEGGDLSKLISSYKRELKLVPEDLVWDILSQLVEALFECHYGHRQTRGIIIHRDIKPENVFIGKNFQVKLGDFGLCKLIGGDLSCDFAKTYVGTPFYMSPEIVNESAYDQGSDIWALGCLIYELCALRPPFEARSQSQLNVKIKSGDIQRIPHFYSDGLNEVIESMIQVDSQKRPSAAEMRQHPQIVLARKERSLMDREQVLRQKEEFLISFEQELAQKSDTLEMLEQELKLSYRRKSIQLDQREQKLKSLELQCSQDFGLNFSSSGASLLRESITATQWPESVEFESTINHQTSQRFSMPASNTRTKSAYDKYWKSDLYRT